MAAHPAHCNLIVNADCLLSCFQPRWSMQATDFDESKMEGSEDHEEEAFLVMTEGEFAALYLGACHDERPPAMETSQQEDPDSADEDAEGGGASIRIGDDQRVTLENGAVQIRLQTLDLDSWTDALEDSADHLVPPDGEGQATPLITPQGKTGTEANPAGVRQDQPLHGTEESLSHAERLRRFQETLISSLVSDGSPRSSPGGVVGRSLLTEKSMAMVLAQTGNAMNVADKHTIREPSDGDVTTLVKEGDAENTTSQVRPVTETNAPVGVGRDSSTSQNQHTSRSGSVLPSFIQPAVREPKRKKTKQERKKRPRVKRSKKGTESENVIISIHRHNVLSRVVLAKDAPYVCGFCGMAVTHASSLKEHVETEHFYEEPEEIASGGIEDQIVMKRTFKDKRARKKSKVNPSASIANTNQGPQKVPLSNRNSYHKPSPSLLLSVDESDESGQSDDDLGGDDGEDDDEDDDGDVAGNDDSEDNLDGGDSEIDGSLQSDDASEPGQVDLFQVDTPKSRMNVSVRSNSKESSAKGSSVSKVSPSAKRAESSGGNRICSGDPATSSAGAGIHPPTEFLVNETSLGISSLPGGTTSGPDAFHSAADEESAPEEEQSKNAKKKRKTDQAIHKCLYCYKRFVLKSLQLAHHAEAHGEFTSLGQINAYRKKKDMDEPVQDLGDTPEIVKCIHCNAYFSEEADVKRHARKHCGQGNIKCEICCEAIQLWKDGKTDDLGNLMKKYDGEIDEEKEAGEVDGEDRIGGEDEGSTAEHSGDAAQDTQEKSSSESEEQRILRRSLERTKMMGSKNFFLMSCVKCGEEFFENHHYMNHIRWHGTLVCEQCGDKFSTMTAYTQHCIKVHRAEFFKCRFCPKMYNEQGKLNYHMLGHFGLFQCIVCGDTVMSKQSLEAHISITIEDPTHVEGCCTEYKLYSAINPYLQHEKGTRRRRRRKVPPCLHCGKKFNHAGHRTRHIIRFHPTQSPQLRDSMKHCCDRCGALLASRASLKNHMLSHSGKTIPCTVPGCSMMFSREMYLKHHLKVHEMRNPALASLSDPVPATFQCVQCGKMLRTENNLTMHLRLHDGTMTEHPCRFCGRIFKNMTHLKYHEKRHTGEKDQVCHHCGKSFTDPSILKTHLFTHATDKPFKCETCERTFPTIVYLRAHTRTHTRPFKCSHCGEGFAQKGSRRRHLLKAHNIIEPAGKKIIPVSTLDITHGLAEEGILGF